MFNLDAPIIPGQSAAGLRIGQSLEEVVAHEKPNDIVPLHGATKYDFGSIHLWVADGTIFQIGLFAGYRGSMQGNIKIGSTLGEIQQTIGPVIEDEEDNLIVSSSPGWSFETEEWLEGHQPEKNANARVSEIYIFRPAV
jgi:hypothetical protein